MKTLAVFVCLLMLMAPALAYAVGEEGTIRIIEKKVEKGLIEKGLETAAEHGGKAMGVGAIGSAIGLHPAGHRAVAIVPATGHAAASSTLAVALISVSIAAVFIGLLVYDLTHPSGAQAFIGSQWDTCANAPWTGPLHDHCKRMGWLSR